MRKKRPFITEREDIAWRLRHRRGWSLRAIARHQGVSVSAISHRLRRLEKRLAGPSGAGRRMRQRKIYLLSLSDVYE